MLSKLAALAANIAHRAHDGQKREGDNTIPYIIHPFRVATIVASYQDDPVVVAAAWLHDVIEDCADWPGGRLLEVGIPNRVVSMVEWLTKPPKDPKKSRFVRIWEYHEQLRKTQKTVKLIKLADRLDNISDLEGMRTDFQLLYAQETIWLLDVLLKDHPEGTPGIFDIGLEISTAVKDIFKRLEYAPPGKSP